MKTILLVAKDCNFPADTIMATRMNNGVVSLGLSDSTKGIPEALFDVGEKDALRLARAILAAHHAANPTEAPSKPVPARRFTNLSTQASLIYQHISRAGSISAREAMNDYGITSATLARRICDIEGEGFDVKRKRRAHPITGRLFTRYSFLNTKVST